VTPQIVRYSERPELWDTGEYGEPNIWIIHQTGGTPG